MGKLRGNIQKKKNVGKSYPIRDQRKMRKDGRGYFRYPMSSVITAIKETVLYIPVHVYIPGFKEN